MWCGQLLNWDSVLRVATPQGSALGLLLLLIYVNDIPGIEIHAARVCVATCCIDIDWMMNCLICCGSTQSVTVYYHLFMYNVWISKSIYLDLHIDYNCSSGEIMLPAYVRRWLTT